MNGQGTSPTSPPDSLYRQLFDDSDDPLALFAGEAATIVQVNPAFCEALRISAAEAIGSQLADLITFESNVAEKLRQRSRDQGTVNFRARTVATEQPLHCQARFVDADGRTTGFLRATPTRWTDDRLRGNLEELLSDVDAIVWECSLSDWRFTYVSPKAEAITGYPVADWLTKYDFLPAIIHPDDRSQAMDYCRVSTEQGIDHEMEYRIVTPHGRLVWVHDVVHVVTGADGQPTCMRGVMVDITERRTAEAALRRSEESLARAQQIARIGTWGANARTGRTTGSSETFRILGVEGLPQISLEDYFDRFVHEADRDALVQAHQVALQTGVIRPMQYRIRRRSDGAIRHVRAEAEFQDADRMQQFGTLQDITELIETRDRLHQSEARYRTIVETTQEWIWETDERGTITFSNPAVARILGYPPAEMLRRPMMDFLVHDSFESSSVARPEEFFKRSGWTNRVLRWKHADGREKVLESNGLPVFDHAGQLTGFRGADRDITDRIAAEESLRQHQHLLAHVSRLSTMGEMVAGIAHEVNQPLAAIAAYADASQRHLRKADVTNSSVFQWLTQISDQAVRCGDIIRRLRGFTRRSDGTRDWISLRALVSDSFKLLQAEAQELNLRFLTDRLVERFSIYVCEVQMQQVLVNLFRNAMDAMRDTQHPKVLVTVTVAESHFAVHVRDNGPGIDDDIADRLFDAFHSTKEDGMGMGLAISRSIIESHGGKLTIRPDSKRGAEFILELPTHALREESDAYVGTADLSRR